MSKLDEEIIQKLVPSWEHRRPLIKAILGWLVLMIVFCLGSAFGLAVVSKFGLYISIFYVTFVLACFIALLGIIGSYIFNARWENKDFLQAFAQIKPNFQQDSGYNSPYGPSLDNVPPFLAGADTTGEDDVRPT